MTDPLAGKRVLVLGLARQGTALAKWLVDIGAHVTISDLRTEDELADALADLDGLPIQYVLGDHPMHLLTRTDLVCLSGGVPLDIPIVKEAPAT